MNKIGIIGGGFSGTMTAVQMIKKAANPCEIIIISDKETFTQCNGFQNERVSRSA